MKKTIVFAGDVVGLLLQTAWAQKVWTEPAVVTSPSDSVKVYIDLTKMDCSRLVGYPCRLNMWTWKPGADPVGGNGTWSASNTDHAFVNESPDIWSITILPTDFYGVSAQDVYDNDIFFLAKALDGGGGGDCSAAGNEWKTEDLSVEVNPPGPLVRKVFSFPMCKMATPLPCAKTTSSLCAMTIASRRKSRCKIQGTCMSMHAPMTPTVLNTSLPCFHKWKQPRLENDTGRHHVHVEYLAGEDFQLASWQDAGLRLPANHETGRIHLQRCGGWILPVSLPL